MNNLISSASQNNFFKKIFNQSPNPMAVIRADNGVYLEINEAFTQYYGKRRQEIIGKTVMEIGFITPEERLGFLMTIKGKRGARNIPVNVLARNDEVRCLLINTTLIKIKHYVAYLVVGTDVPEFYLSKKTIRSDVVMKTFDAIEGAGVILLSDFEDKKPSVFYVNQEAKLFLEEHSLNNLLPDLKRKESLFLKACSRYYHVKIIAGHKDSPLRLIVLERFPDNFFLKRILNKYKLTPRQREIALLSSTGLSNREISKKLSISEYTVKDHIKDIFKTVGIRNRSEFFPKLLNLR